MRVTGAIVAQYCTASATTQWETALTFLLSCGARKLPWRRSSMLDPFVALLWRSCQLTWPSRIACRCPSGKWKRDNRKTVAEMDKGMAKIDLVRMCSDLVPSGAIEATPHSPRKRFGASGILAVERSTFLALVFMDQLCKVIEGEKRGEGKCQYCTDKGHIVEPARSVAGLSTYPRYPCCAADRCCWSGKGWMMKGLAPCSTGCEIAVPNDGALIAMGKESVAQSGETDVGL